MEFLKHTFLEAPFLVFITTGMAELVTVAVWQKTHARRVLVMLVVWPCVAVAVALLAAAVQTDREKITATWLDIESAIEAEDTDRLMRGIAEDFSSGGLDHEALRRLADEARTVMAPGAVRFDGFTLHEIADGKATATVRAVYIRGGYPTDWTLTFAAQPDGAWRLAGAECRRPATLKLRAAVNQLKQLKGVGG